jgi:hypothetical protein
MIYGVYAYDSCNFRYENDSLSHTGEIPCIRKNNRRMKNTIFSRIHPFPCWSKKDGP